jgi:hypothetical protein
MYGENNNCCDYTISANQTVYVRVQKYKYDAICYPFSSHRDPKSWRPVHPGQRRRRITGQSRTQVYLKSFCHFLLLLFCSDRLFIKIKFKKTNQIHLRGNGFLLAVVGGAG